jgi:hypothetical protein
MKPPAEPPDRLPPPRVIEDGVWWFPVVAVFVAAVGIAVAVFVLIGQ